MKKAVSIFERNDKWYIHPDCLTITGPWIPGPPFLEVDRRDSVENKYQAIMKALQESKSGLPVPSNVSEELKPLFRMAKVRSWSEFAKGAKYVALDLMNDQIVITPHRKMKRYKSAFEPILEQAIRLPMDAGPEKIVEAISEALSHSQ
ncbi:MAG: hypothetical protein KatS3mg106_530 [Gemmataceae bacterium]|jgi:hypothetical protein|nr:MAG: hypothetical protein KatS3mg106_530 [Gemmataceae bacterium]